MIDLIRYEPFFGKYLFSHQGDLYIVDGPIKPEPGTFITVPVCNPHNGLSIPAKVQIQVTNRCNANCPHCYANSGTEHDSEMSDSEIFSLLEESQREGVLQIEWSGGDPFVRKGFTSLLEYAHSLGFEQDILTNGVALGRKQGLVQGIWKYVHAVQVSIDGYGEKFDAWVGLHAWESVLKGITDLIAEKPPFGQVSVATTLDKQNLMDLESIGLLLSRLNVDTWLLARQVRNGRSSISEEEADELLSISYDVLQKMRKEDKKLIPRVLHPFDKGEQNVEESILPVEWVTEPAARTFLYVSANGDVYPFPYYEGYTEWKGGNIHTSNLVDLWYSEAFTRMRSVTRNHTGCGECKRICQLWSRWFNYGRRRDIYEPPIEHLTCVTRS